MDQPGAMQPQSELKGSSSKGELLAESPQPPREPVAPPVVPDYDLLRRIGHGAYGDVWLARSRATGALRAAKIVWRHTFEDAKPFQREFAGIQRFERISREHPSQLALFHIGRNDPGGYFYYVMELADQAEPGPTLVGRDVPSAPRRVEDSPHYQPHILRADLEKGRLPAAKVLEIGLALSEALSHLHSNGLVHRDVKPSNVIFVNGRPKLADIGLVTDASDQCSIVGTEGYLPPEGPGTPQADIFALGKVLYESATGLDRRSFPDFPPDVRSWPDADQVFELNEIILKACAQDSKDRYQTCDEMQADLALLGQGKSVKQKRTRQQRWAVAKKTLVAAAALILVVAGVVFLWQTISRHNPPAVPSADEVGAVGTSNPKAADAYRLGLQSLRVGTSEEFRRALGYFQDALDADPSFVAAYARLFEAHLMVVDDDVATMPGTPEQLEKLSEQLTKLAPTNAETHAAKAIVFFLNEWKWVEAENEFKQALKADPNCRMALTYYGYFLTRQRRASEARAVLERALAWDRISPLINKFLGHCYYVQRDYEKALPFYLHASALDTRYPSAYYWAGRVDLAITNYPAALDELEHYESQLAIDLPTGWRFDLYREALQKQGSRGYWMKRIELAKDQAPFSQSPYKYAEYCARLGDKSQALAWLEKALAQRDSMENLLVDEFWDDFRQDPKFQEILRKVGLYAWAR